MFFNAQIIAAASLLFTTGTYAADTISKGSGFGTYYYDVEQVDACGTSFAAQNTGTVMCSHIDVLPLTEINSNYVVAMNNTELSADLDQYCGKKVIVSVNGKKSDLPLFIGDGCQRCGTGASDAKTWDAQGAPGLDFSYSVLNELSGDAACDNGHIDISWEIVDESIHKFNTA
ncbi:hypothetical protein V492_08019 [Pseudogymnoascus sp. VKM F-4246]|nr:hypothetical protein V492_08019 [Pseudogymnoascus sp. VKM F-4246]KFY44795.1 hypothetical protein V494_01320 [Pseudogymnoascus sp. VKM F-4513 (FW-928)]